MPTCKGICPRTDAYFCFATDAEIGSRRGEHNSTKTLSVEIIKFPIRLTLFFTFFMKIYYTRVV